MKTALSRLDQHNRVRNVLALVIVVGYVLGLGVVGLVFPFIKGLTPEPLEHLKTMSSIFSGLAGMGVGYYFGKS